MDKKSTATVVSLADYKAKREAEFYRTPAGLDCILAELEELEKEIDAFVKSERAKEQDKPDDE